MSTEAEAIVLSDSESDDQEEPPPAPTSPGHTPGGQALDLTAEDEDATAQKPQDVVADTAEQMVKTYKERREAHKRTKLKYNSWPNSKSRKKRYQAMGAPVKDSKRVYHAKTMQTLFIQAFLQIPGVREALQQLRAKREEDERESRDMLHEALTEEAEEKNEAVVVEQEEISEPVVTTAWGPAGVAVSAEEERAAPREGDTIVAGERRRLDWPEGVHRSLDLDVADGIHLKDTWPADRCDCFGDCYADVCPNAGGNLFCADDNCHFAGRCSNGVYECSDVELFASRTGIGVRATDTINVNTNIAPYTGFLTDFNYDEAEGQYEYVIGLQSKGKGNKSLFIDAEHWGTMARFVNHSCTPNTQFVEKRHNKEVHVMVQTMREINPGEEITVDYNVTWFTHGCRTTRCRDPNNPIFLEAKRPRK